MNRNIIYSTISLFASLLFFMAGIFLYDQEQILPEIKNTAAKIEKHLHEQEEEVKEFATNIPLLTIILNDELDQTELEQLNKKRQILLLYRNDSLLFWNKNQAFPQQNISSYAGYDEILNLRNGTYELIRRKVYINGDTIYVAGLIPLKYKYQIQNKYLENRIAFNVEQGNQIGFSLEPTAQSAPVNDEKGNPLFHIYYTEEATQATIDVIPLLCILIAVFFLLLFLNFMGVSIGNKTKPVYGFTFVALAFILLRYISLYSFYPLLLKNYEFFNPHYYATAYSPSLGDLVITVVMGLWLIIYFYRMISVKINLGRGKSFVLTTVIYTVILLIVLLISRVIRSLVIDSHISFDINYFLSLNIFSLIGLILIGLMVLGLYLMSYRLLLINKFLNTSITNNSIALGIAAIILILFTFELNVQFLYVILIGIAFIIIASVFISRRVSMIGFSSIIFWLIFFSFYTALLLNKYISKKEWENRKQYSYRLSEEKDVVAEYLFGEVKDDILADPFIKGYFQNPFIRKKELKDRISRHYIKDDLKKYDISIHTFLPPNVPFKEDQQDLSLNKFISRIDSAGRRTRIEDLYFFPGSLGNYRYISILPIYDVGYDNLLGRLVIQFYPKSYSFTNVYPELLLEEDLKPSSEFENYDFAVYVNNRLQKNRGEYPYDLQIKTKKLAEFERVQENNFLHLIYTPAPGYSVWITKERLSSFEPLSLFSYIFCLYLAIVVVILLARGFFILKQYKFRLTPIFRISFRHRIQIFVIAIIVISFLLIGTLTVLNISRQYDDYHHERLLRKVKQVQAGLEYMKNDLDSLPSTWSRFFADEDVLFQNITTLSDIHSMDINLYSINGNAITSSQPAIFEKGLITQKIDPIAYYQIIEEDKSQYIQIEEIGYLDYLSAYVPITNDQREIVAILNLPYFAKEKNLQSEISDFLVYFINVYVLLLVFAGIIGLIISNSITKPITEIGSKLKQIRLGERNEPITWRLDDEIGRLVNEYNKMIRELERSAELLAKSERESAWREMAKQVAHEIKNPLTPMKLSIQHLQRAARERSPNLDVLIENVTNTLIEQIENLSSIASEFSSFAKMPVANKEFLSLNDVLKSVSELYKNQEVEIDLKIPSTEYFIFADKGQMIRVFNNLIKNSIQAIPDEKIGKIFIGMRKQGEMVRVKVEDNGIGIPADQQEKVFVPNFTTKGSGMGLGLAITKNIIESAGGKIWFESQIDEGTTFYLDLPAYSENYVKKQIS